MNYSETFKKHLADPRNAGPLEDADAEVEQSNPVCGDRLRLALRVRGRRVEAARFLAYGCPPTIVCGSALASLLEGMTLDEAARVTRAEIAEAAGGLPARKQHAAALAFETLQAALKELQKQQADGGRQLKDNNIPKHSGRRD